MRRLMECVFLMNLQLNYWHAQTNPYIYIYGIFEDREYVCDEQQLSSDVNVLSLCTSATAGRSKHTHTHTYTRDWLSSSKSLSYNYHQKIDGLTLLWLNWEHWIIHWLVCYDYRTRHWQEKRGHLTSEWYGLRLHHIVNWWEKATVH